MAKKAKKTKKQSSTMARAVRKVKKAANSATRAVKKMMPRKEARQEEIFASIKLEPQRYAQSALDSCQGVFACSQKGRLTAAG